MRHQIDYQMFQIREKIYRILEFSKKIVRTCEVPITALLRYLKTTVTNYVKSMAYR